MILSLSYENTYYKRVSPSVHPSVRLLVRPLVCWSVSTLFKTAKKALLPLPNHLLPRLAVHVLTTNSLVYSFFACSLACLLAERVGINKYHAFVQLYSSYHVMMHFRRLLKWN